VRHYLRARAFWLAIVLALSFGGTGRAADMAVASRSQLVGALRSGKPVVLVIANNASAKSTDETYGDWADALNTFAARKDPGIKIVKQTPRSYRLAVASPRIAEQFATLFIRDLNHALLYRGMILEPQVYRLGEDYLFKRPDPSPEKAYGLISTTIRLRGSSRRSQRFSFPQIPSTQQHAGIGGGCVGRFLIV
jgi:hypothetical protein